MTMEAFPQYFPSSASQSLEVESTICKTEEMRWKPRCSLLLVLLCVSSTLIVLSPSGTLIVLYPRTGHSSSAFQCNSLSFLHCSRLISQAFCRTPHVLALKLLPFHSNQVSTYSDRCILFASDVPTRCTEVGESGLHWQKDSHCILNSLHKWYIGILDFCPLAWLNTTCESFCMERRCHETCWVVSWELSGLGLRAQALVLLAHTEGHSHGFVTKVAQLGEGSEQVVYTSSQSVNKYILFTDKAWYSSTS